MYFICRTVEDSHVSRDSPDGRLILPFTGISPSLAHILLPPSVASSRFSLGTISKTSFKLFVSAVIASLPIAFHQGPTVLPYPYSLRAFGYPVASTRTLSRPIRPRIAANNSRDTATSAIWKMRYRAWQITFAPILITFSRNVVIVQCRTHFGSAVWRKKFPKLYASAKSCSRT